VAEPWSALVDVFVQKGAGGPFLAQEESEADAMTVRDSSGSPEPEADLGHETEANDQGFCRGSRTGTVDRDRLGGTPEGTLDHRADLLDDLSESLEADPHSQAIGRSDGARREGSAQRRGRGRSGVAGAWGGGLLIGASVRSVRTRCTMTRTRAMITSPGRCSRVAERLDDVVPARAEAVADRASAAHQIEQPITVKMANLPRAISASRREDTKERTRG